MVGQSMDAYAFRAIPFDGPRRRGARELWGDVKAGLDFVAHNLPRAHGFLARVNPYPLPWREVRVATQDGALLAAVHGPGQPGAPAILMVCGTFQTKDDTPRKRRAIQLWRRFGAHVLVLDQRGFGGSHAYPGTAGYLEARDVLDAADWLRAASGADKVVAWGESLGGAVALLAGARPEAASRLSRVIAWSPFAELGDATRAASSHSRRGRTMLGRTYRWLIRERTHGEASDFQAYLALRARELGLHLEDLLRAGSPLAHCGSLAVPATVFHAEDDPVVPVVHARRLRELAECGKAPRLDVHVVPRGRHLDFDREAPQWYAAVTSRLLA